MACKECIPAIIGRKPPSLRGHARARSLAAALTLGAGVALSAVTVSSAIAQELEWARSAGGDGDDEFDLGRGIATDPRGNGYVTGGFSGTATFGADEANETELTAAGDFDVFVAKYAPDGALLWATSAGGTSFDEGLGIATDPRGNGYVTGRFSGTATFGADEANETELTAAAGFQFDVFVAKYAPDGALLWATSAGGTSFDEGLGIATDPRGNGYVTGLFSGTATFGADKANETELTTAAGSSDVFVAKYAADGTLIWATSAGGDEDDAGASGIATDPRGNGYVTGGFSGTATFGAGEANETELTAAGFADVFVAKYAPDGTLLWATSAGGGALGRGIATDPRGNGYVTGQFFGMATFGAGEANETELTAAGSSDVFVAKYAADGTLLWATRAGGTFFVEGSGIATDPRGNGYVTGLFSGTATFGADEANETELTSAAGHFNVFVAKYAPDGALLWATSAGGFHGLGIATARGNGYVTGLFSGTATFGADEANETELTTAAGSSDVFVAKYRDRKDQDQCPDPDPRATVVIDGNDTGVGNVRTGTGCTILDLILEALRDAMNRDDFIRSVALLTRRLLNDGLITAEQAGIIRTAASQATFPLR